MHDLASTSSATRIGQTSRFLQISGFVDAAFLNEILLFGSIWEINYDKLVGRMMFYDVLKLLRDINIAGIALENSCPGLWCQDVNVPSGGPRTSFSVDASSRCAI